MTTLKFTPIQSFIDSSFFTKLADLKLNKYKLESTESKITGFQSKPSKLNKYNDTTIVYLYDDSFDAEDLVPRNDDKWPLNGEILNVNTIEEFKGLNKQELLSKWGAEIHEKISKAESFDLNVFNPFYVLSFSDLKKYKFYYWVAFPTINNSWTIKEESQEISKNLIDELSEKSEQVIGQFYQLDSNILFNKLDKSKKSVFVFFDSCLNADNKPSIQLKNYLYYLAWNEINSLELIVYRNNGTSFTQKLKLESLSNPPKYTGWERTTEGKLGPKLADLGLLIDPQQLAKQAVELNLKLMKWRIAPELNLDILKQQKVLLLGAGTLGSYVARVLLGWGFNDITFVDNGRISYSNPVRQPLFNFVDCSSDNGRGELKAIKASENLKSIYPGVNSEGFNLEVPMIGHPVTDEERQKENFDKLDQLFDNHDVVFLLMDSRESRWLPTVLGAAKNKIVMNAALGFDSYLVMRHGSVEQSSTERLGCYYCNDVVAPEDSLTDRTLDQMCTVTRPGGALMAASLAVELLVSLLQHPKKQLIKHNERTKFSNAPHQIRGFLNNFSQTSLYTPNYKHCSACSEIVLSKYKDEGWEFVKKCLNDTKYLEDICGLTQVQEEAEKALQEMTIDDFDEDIDEDNEIL
ncbi:ATG7 [Candida pseudojiufengensis]|uniref:ATG7 n=1 Tax=Candida pseudojiufengensis TaxID=497109 RepID=UPI0022259B11|nr:ATG7 [Candida pseudojiufengensis]KAI5962514.1 ATG7 [Candida pseudojiufengensis]